ISGSARRVPLERGELFPPDERAVLADVALLQPEGGRFAPPQRRERVDAGCQVVGVRDVPKRLLEQFLAGVADDGAELLVDAEEGPGAPPVGEADRRILERPAKPLLAGAQPLLELQAFEFGRRASSKDAKREQIAWLGGHRPLVEDRQVAEVP